MSFSIYFPLIALAIIQGIIEWLPISSSGILVFLEQLINLEDKNINLLFNFLSLLLFFNDYLVNKSLLKYNDMVIYII